MPLLIEFKTQIMYLNNELLCLKPRPIYMLDCKITQPTIAFSIIIVSILDSGVVIVVLG